MGLILPQEVEVKVASVSYIHYQDKGYTIPKRIGVDGNEKLAIGETFTIHVLDLMDKSNTKVKIQCDYCGCVDEVTWKKVIKSISHKDNNKITCSKCRGKKTQDAQRKRIIKETNINPLYWNKVWLKEEYLRKNRTAQSIADECGVHIRRIEKYIKQFNLDRKFIEPKIKMPKELLHKLYVIEHMQPEEIRLAYQIDRSTIMKLLDEYKIPRRNHSESMAIYYDERGGRELKSIDNKEVWTRDGYKEKMINIKKIHPK
jgi:hypothetical protein